MRAFSKCVCTVQPDMYAHIRNFFVFPRNMQFDRSHIAKLELLVPADTMYMLMNTLFVVGHAVAFNYLYASIGEPYRLVIEELSAEAVRNGTVLMMDEIKSTDDNPLPGESSPSPVAVIICIVSVGIHLLYYLLQKWSVAFKVSQQFKKVKSIGSKPTHACVYPPEFREKSVVVPLERNPTELGSYWFTFQRRKYALSESQVTPLKYNIDIPVSSFCTSNDGLTDTEVASRQSLYGFNKVDIPVPPFYELYIQQLMSPVPIFQLFCSALWMMDEYWKYTLFTLFTIFGFEVSTAMQRKKSLETLRSMSGKVIIEVLAKRKSTGEFTYIPILSDQLVPGDRMRLLPNTTVVPCDCVIVAGTAVVNEASLTGESVPQMKDSIEVGRGDDLDIMNSDRVHAIFSGTTIVRADPAMELIVARTGAQSSQGELLRMVEFSQQEMTSDKKETMWLLMFLLVFALIAAGYVVYERISGTGTEKLTKMKTHKLILRVIMIITSVVPPELPLQMSLSVNTALMALGKMGIFCTEPFRVPMAGSVTHCLFDKTGTLTSDQLKCLGVDGDDTRMAKMVMAGCHSLIEGGTPGSLVGDPIETTGLEFSGWTYKDNVAVESDRKMKIVHRFHFSSALQRMSVIVKEERGGYFALVKGSPEVILERVDDAKKNKKFLAKYAELANSGKRVLALAYKTYPSGVVPDMSHRDLAETDLTFAGFASFAVETRADTSMVISALSDAAGLPCIMVTGDALLTAVHVARETGIIKKPSCDVLKLARGASEELCWKQLTETDSDRRIVPFVESRIAKLAAQFDLVVSCDVPGVKSIINLLCMHVKVFARMTPTQKELVVAGIRLSGGRPLMCGDGGNDVGALKQADVGVALLAGFGAANTGGSSSELADDAEAALERDAKIVALRERKLGAEFQKEFAEKRKKISTMQQVWLQEELAKPDSPGYWGAIKTVTARMREELAKESKELQGKYGVGQAWARGSVPTNDSSSSAASRPVVQMGDASVAAPFTSRAPSIRAVVQIIRQGRCTLLVAVQTMQIMMLESLVSAYTFAAITMEGGRSTEIQLIGSSVFVMIASIAFTYAQPNKKLSKVLPLKSVFSPAIFVSVLVQVTIHLGVLVYAMNWAKSQMGPDALSELYEFERIRDEKLTKAMAVQEEASADVSSWMTGGVDMWNMFKSVPYSPNLLNTVMFLVKTSQQVAVLVVNYKGSPWMQGALENKALFLSMFSCALGIVVCSTGYVPVVNDTLELMVLPTLLRNKLLLLLAMSTIGSFLADRIIVGLFAPKIFVASTLEPLLATGVADFLPILKTCGYILAGVVAAPIVLGSPIGIIGGIYGYRRYRQWKTEQENKELEKYLENK
jgi:manganese-transporting P-type ATPase